MTKIFVITVKKLKPAISFVKEQDATTVPARHMWETGSLNWALIYASVIYQIPCICWIHWIQWKFCSIWEKITLYTWSNAIQDHLVNWTFVAHLSLLCWAVVELFSKCTRLKIIPILATEALLREKNPVKNVTPSGNRTQVSHNLWFQVQHSTFWTKLTFACKTETLGSLYSHALLILTEYWIIQVKKSSCAWTEV